MRLGALVKLYILHTFEPVQFWPNVTTWDRSSGRFWDMVQYPYFCKQGKSLPIFANSWKKPNIGQIETLTEICGSFKNRARITEICRSMSEISGPFLAINDRWGNLGDQCHRKMNESRSAFRDLSTKRQGAGLAGRTINFQIFFWKVNCSFAYKWD